MTICEFQSKRISRISGAVAHFVSTTAPDRLTWRPYADDSEPQTRTILEQVSECVIVNRVAAGILRGETFDLSPRNAPQIEFADAADAQNQIVESGKALAATLAAMDDSMLDRIYETWRGPLRGEVLIEMPYRNMAYHAGQINLIQMLAGDPEFHMPPNEWI